MRRALAALVLSALPACGTTVTHELPFQPLTPHDRDVPLYVESVPDVPYADAGLVQVFGYGLEATHEHVERALKSAAKHMGCDAVARVRVDETMSGEAHGVGVCIVWSR